MKKQNETHSTNFYRVVFSSISPSFPDTFSVFPCGDVTAIYVYMKKKSYRIWTPLGNSFYVSEECEVFTVIKTCVQ